MTPVTTEAGDIASTHRIEHDLLGSYRVPADAYYGVQTARASDNFRISDVLMDQFPELVEAFGYVKKAAAMANAELGVLDAERSRVICAACDEIIAGRFHDQFILDMLQGGAGTSANMNANEVIANRGLELMGYEKGEYQYLHPNDHVNMSQSTNDVYPTAIKLAVHIALDPTIAAMARLTAALEAKSDEFSDVVKMGRTENQDAVPMSLGQEFGAYARMVDEGKGWLLDAQKEMLRINLGATAIGTGINALPGYGEKVTDLLRTVSGIPVSRAEDLVEATQDAGAFGYVSSALKRCAIELSKISNDLRWLSSGPRCGFGEIELPALQPGSSIMPGKINPVIPEAVNQVCFQLTAYDTAVSMAAAAGELELNAMEPVMAFDLLTGMRLLRQACVLLAERCVDGIKANRERCRAFVDSSVGIVTALVPAIGYERSAQIATEALESGSTVRELILGRGWMRAEQFDAAVDPAKMLQPHRVSAASGVSSQA